MEQSMNNHEQSMMIRTNQWMIWNGQQVYWNDQWTIQNDQWHFQNNQWMFGIARLLKHRYYFMNKNYVIPRKSVQSLVIPTGYIYTCLVHEITRKNEYWVYVTSVVFIRLHILLVVIIVVSVVVVPKIACQH